MKNSSREILPQAPDPAVQALLSVQRLRFLQISAGESLELPGRPDQCTVFAVEKGHLTFSAESGNQYCLMEEGQAAASVLDTLCILSAVTPCSLILVELQGSVPAGLLGDSLTDGFALFPGGLPAVQEAARSLSSQSREDTPVAAGTASAACWNMLLKLRAASQEPPERPLLVEAAVSIIQDEFATLEGMDELAERLEVSKGYLSRIFTETVGVSPGKYLIRMRIACAKELLLDPDMTVTFAAEACGFSCANYFAKAFRRETGMSPTEYVKRFRDGSGGHLHLLL